MIEYKKFKDIPDELQERLTDIIMDIKTSIYDYNPTFQLNVLILCVYDFLLDCEHPHEIHAIFSESLKRMMDNHKSQHAAD
jgi:hypothetical protein